MIGRLTAWRITQAAFAGVAFTGEGARRYPGRWNPAGLPVVYTAGSLSLAVLEMLVHLDDAALLEQYIAIPVEFGENLCSRLPRASLPVEWRACPPGAATRHLGADWIRGRHSAVLDVPSVVIPHERNFLLNPNHPDFGKIKRGTPAPLPFDRRLLGHP